MITPAQRDLLTPPEREAVALHELGYGYRSIARILGISMTTVRDRLDRAAQRIANSQEHPDE